MRLQAEARTLRRDLEGAAAAREAAQADARAQADASGAAAQAHAARVEGLSADVARLTAENAALQAQVAERGAAGSAADPQACLRHQPPRPLPEPMRSCFVLWHTLALIA